MFYELFSNIKILLAFWCLLMYILYLICGKESKVIYKEKYHPSPPNNFSPVEMKQLINYGKLYPKDAIAEYIYLILQDVLIFEKRKDKYKIILNKNYDLSSLEEHDTFLLKILIEYLGNGKELQLSHIFELKPNKSYLVQFKLQFRKWLKIVSHNKKSKEFFYPKKRGLSFGIAVSSCYFISAVWLAFDFNKITYLILLIPASITLVYSVSAIRRKPQAQFQYELCMAFKRYLKDLDINDENISIETCEKYLPYAVSLGVPFQLLEYIDKKDKLYFENSNLKILNKISPQALDSLLYKIINLMEKTILN